MYDIEKESVESREVTVVDVKMPFISMVVFMVKLALASVPALIIVTFIFMVLGSLFGGFFNHRMGMFY
ncbi:MAG: hypothetical protein AB7E04_08115 [Desulfobacteraceae bacterium]